MSSSLIVFGGVYKAGLHLAVVVIQDLEDWLDRTETSPPCVFVLNRQSTLSSCRVLHPTYPSLPKSFRKALPSIINKYSAQEAVKPSGKPEAPRFPGHSQMQPHSASRYLKELTITSILKTSLTNNDNRQLTSITSSVALAVSLTVLVAVRTGLSSQVAQHISCYAAFSALVSGVGLFGARRVRSI